MSIDMHNHFYPRPYIERLKRETGIPRVEATPAGEYFVIFPEELHAGQSQAAVAPQGRPFGPEYWDVGEKLAWMDRAGIDRIVMSIGNPWVDFLPAPEAVVWARRLNDTLLEIHQSHPTRIAAMGVLPCSDIDAAVTEIHRIRRAGMCGVILSTRPGGVRLDDHRLWPVLGAAADLAMPVFIHPHYSLGGDLDGYGHGLPLVYGFIFETTVAVTRLILGGALETFSTLKVIAAHLGGTLPYAAGRVAAWQVAPDTSAPSLRRPFGEYLKKLYVDVISYHGPAVHSAALTLGVDHLMMGSDHPFGISNLDLIRASLRDAGFSSAEQKQIMDTTAQHLFGF